MAKRFPWKSNYRQIPSFVQIALSEIDGDLIAVSASKKINRREVEAGQYAHVGLSADGSAIIANGPTQPHADAGKWSARNAYGWDRKREDWPMVQKTWTFESPNFGDGARNGWTMRSWSKDVYQHQIFEPQGMTIEASVLEDKGGEQVVVKFALTPILSRGMAEFDLMLLWALNVLQENTGVTGVFASDATREEYISTITLDWQIFPPGTADEVVLRLLGTAHPTNIPDFEKHVRERVLLFENFEPKAYIRGQGGFGSYFGAQFADDLVVFENLKYGNAVYLLYQNWDEASQRSRLDLLRDQDAHFDRVVHTDGWQDRLTSLLHDKLFERGLRRRRSGYRSKRRGRSREESDDRGDRQANDGERGR
ncbi:hypothetical protein H7F50_17250 [Novosphingobium flavum]|uniref:hypothetical protein n=1 Tax=Novosphingobium aerophilum TaxID=2839843 RepID=UPI00163A6D78|nr:hypothetical protein [Novosphingobium aerophilum]MBC2663490.1 hypothetical protein [Novosphingobium aerophilum]